MHAQLAWLSTDFGKWKDEDEEEDVKTEIPDFAGSGFGAPGGDFDFSSVSAGLSLEIVFLTAVFHRFVSRLSACFNKPRTDVMMLV
jgi:hypothetical protein